MVERVLNLGLRRAPFQHAHPGGVLQVFLVLMQVSPQGCPLVQRLQQERACWAASPHVNVVAGGAD